MIKSLNIRNFQSLKKVDLELGNFTVIVGPSSSGKSAVVRAIRTLTDNCRGGSFVTHGSKRAVIQAVTTSGTAIFLRDSSGSSYTVALTGQEPVAYTKLAGSVPEPVTALLGLSTDLQVAGQFDKPFLLDSSGGEVARVLGELTNVSVIFEAARESNKRKLQASSVLKMRQRDFDQIIVKLREFQDLPVKLKKLDEAERFLSQTTILNEKVSRLASLISAISSSESVLASIPQSSFLVPDLLALDHAQLRLNEFKSLIRDISYHRSEEYRLSATVQTETETVKYLEQGLKEILASARICPTCGQTLGDTNDNG